MSAGDGSPKGRIWEGELLQSFGLNGYGHIGLALLRCSLEVTSLGPRSNNRRYLSELQQPKSATQKR